MTTAEQKFVQQLRDDAANLKSSVDLLQDQVQRLLDVERAERAKVNDLAAKVDVLTHQHERQQNRIERFEHLVEEVAKLTARSDETHKQIEKWDNRLWGLVAALVLTLVSTLGRLITVIATTVLKK